MVLVLNGIRQSEYPRDTRSLYISHPVYARTAETLYASPKRVVGPAGLLYVLQREFAATLPGDKNVSVIGSDDATTCIIVVVRHSGSGAVALGHFDGSGTEEAVLEMIDKVQKLASSPEGRVEVQLVGGFTDAPCMSENLFRALMSAFHRHTVEVDLTLACVGQMNTEIRDGIPWPILYGVGVTVETGELFPATFPEKGPEQHLRCARHLSYNREILDIYDSGSGLLTIGPFHYSLPMGADFLEGQDDRFLLENLSTSPEVEPPYFVAQIRATFRYMRENPAETVFRDGKPRCFRRDEHSGLWIPATVLQ